MNAVCTHEIIRVEHTNQTYISVGNGFIINKIGNNAVRLKAGHYLYFCLLKWSIFIQLVKKKLQNLDVVTGEQDDVLNLWMET
jgi:hypothetical protein